MVIAIREGSDIPIYQQIRDQIVQGISDGRLQMGEQLPTVRALAEEIGINSMTVNKAYQLLKQQGYIIADRRNGARVSKSFAKASQLSPPSRELLLRITAEAKVGGMTKEEFLDECRRCYESSALAGEKGKMLEPKNEWKNGNKRENEKERKKRNGQENGNGQESRNEQKNGNVQESRNGQENGNVQESRNERENRNEQESRNERKNGNGQKNEKEQEKETRDLQRTTKGKDLQTAEVLGNPSEEQRSETSENLEGRGAYAT